MRLYVYVFICCVVFNSIFFIFLYYTKYNINMASICSNVIIPYTTVPFLIKLNNKYNRLLMFVTFLSYVIWAIVYFVLIEREKEFIKIISNLTNMNIHSEYGMEYSKYARAYYAYTEYLTNMSRVVKSCALIVNLLLFRIVMLQTLQYSKLVTLTKREIATNKVDNFEEDILIQDLRKINKENRANVKKANKDRSDKKKSIINKVATEHNENTMFRKLS